VIAVVDATVIAVVDAENARSAAVARLSLA
jgi:hypothetical protein